MNRRTAAVVFAGGLALVVAHAAAAPPAPSPRPGPAPIIAPSPNQPQIDAMFAAWDLDHDGALSREEFRRGAGNVRTALVDRRLQAQFNAVDVDKNGGIDAAEYASLLLVKRAGTTAPPLSTFDANHDQRLNFAEYTDMVRRLASPPPRAAPRGAAHKPARR